MTQLAWDLVGERTFETGVDHGVLYEPDGSGEYGNGVAWNGLVSVTESPSGAEAAPQYADNMKYLNLVSAENFSATIEAFTYPVEFEKFDGSAGPTPGVTIGQQARKTFGFSYRTKKGNDTDGVDYGYKLHLIYGCLAAPSEKAHNTINDTPEAITFSWELSTSPVAVGEVGGVEYKPTASLTIDSTMVDAGMLATLEEQLYGTVSLDPSMPLPADVFAMMTVALTTVDPNVPAYNSTTKVITIPVQTGVVYTIDGEVVTGDVTITEDTIVHAEPADGYKFPTVVDEDWLYNF